MVNLSQSLSELEIDVLSNLLDAPDFELQWCKLKKVLESKYVPTHYDQGSFGVILGRKLTNLEDKFVKRKDKGHKQVFYFIPPLKEKKVRDLVKKKFIVNLLDLASAEETSAITDFLFKSTRTYGAVVSNEDALFFSVLLEKLKIRKKLEDLKRLGAPKEVIAIGERKVKGEELKLSFGESLMFEGYPVTLEEAKNHFLVTDFKNSKRGDSFFEDIKEEKEEFASILSARYKQFLGFNPFLH